METRSLRAADNYETSLMDWRPLSGLEVKEDWDQFFEQEKERWEFLKGLLRSTYDDDESMEWDEFLYLRRVCLKFGVSKEELLMLCRGFWGPKDHPRSGAVHWKNWTEQKDRAERELVDFMKENWASVAYYNQYLGNTKLGLDFLDQHPKGNLKKLALYAYEVELDPDTDDIKNVHTYKRPKPLRLLQAHFRRRKDKSAPQDRDLQSGATWTLKGGGNSQEGAQYTRFVKTRDRIAHKLSDQICQRQYDVTTEAAPISDDKNQVFCLQVAPPRSSYDGSYDYNELPADVEIFSEGKTVNTLMHTLMHTLIHAHTLIHTRTHMLTQARSCRTSPRPEVHSRRTGLRWRRR
jgi:hypothetical protein